MKYVEVYVKGPGQGREAAIRALQTAGLEVTMIKDVTQSRTTDAVLQREDVYSILKGGKFYYG